MELAAKLSSGNLSAEEKAAVQAQQAELKQQMDAASCWLLCSVFCCCCCVVVVLRVGS